MKLKIIILGLLLLSGRLEASDQASLFPDSPTVQAIASQLTADLQSINTLQNTWNQQQDISNLRALLIGCRTAMSHGKPYTDIFIAREAYLAQNPQVDLHFTYVNQLLANAQTFREFEMRKNGLYSAVLQVKARVALSPYWLACDAFNSIFDIALQAITVCQNDNYKFVPSYPNPNWNAAALATILGGMKLNTMAKTYCTFKVFGTSIVLAGSPSKILDMYAPQFAQSSLDILETPENQQPFLTSLENASQVILECYDAQVNVNNTQNPSDDTLTNLESTYASIQNLDDLNTIFDSQYSDMLNNIIIPQNLQSNPYWQTYEAFKTIRTNIVSDPNTQNVDFEKLKWYQRAWYYLTFIKVQEPPMVVPVVPDDDSNS